MPTYRLTYKTVDWNLLWATLDEMKVAWLAIEQGDVGTLRESILANPKIARWEDDDFFHRFGESKRPTLELLDCIIDVMGPIDEFERGNEKFFRPATLHGELTQTAAELLLARGANVDAEAGLGWTPLANAIQQGRVDLVETYLNAGANTHYQNPEQKTPLQASIDLGHPEIESLLRQSNAPLKGIPCVTWKSKPESSVRIELDDQAETIKKVFADAVDAWAKRGNESVGSIVVDVSGVRGYVHLAMASSPIEPYSPDCCADLEPLVKLDVAAWREAHRSHQQVVAGFAGREFKATGSSQFSKRDKPFYDFVRGLFLNAVKEGVFDSVPTIDATIYGCQSYYFHHCDCWNHRKKKIAVAKEWSEAGQRDPKKLSGKGDKIATPPATDNTLTRTFKVSADHVIYFARINGWALRNTASLWRVENSAKKQSQRIPVKYGRLPLSLDEKGEYLLAGCKDGVTCIDLKTWETLGHLKLERNLGDLSSMPADEAAGCNWFYFEMYSPTPLTRIELDRDQKLCQHTIQLPVAEQPHGQISTAKYHLASGLLAMKVHLEKKIQIGLVEDDQMKVIRTVDLESEMSVIDDFQWSPLKKHLIVRGDDHDDSMMLLVLDTKTESVIASTSLGNAELGGEIQHEPDGRHFAMKVTSSMDQAAKCQWPQRDTVVVFDALTLEYRSHLPTEDISCYDWSSDGKEILVGGYKESTLWSVGEIGL